MNFPTVAVIGSGFSGLTSAIQLKKKLGITAEIFEATSDIGGTWNYNTYPGCSSDLPSHLYSFSFELNPNWSKKYGSQKEIHEYMCKVAKKYEVYSHIKFETSVIRATWHGNKKKWELELNCSSQEKNQIKYFDFIFSGVGSIRIPHIPKEFEAFEGKIIHSASWEHDYDLNNKRVAVIGSGTSSIQIIPNIVNTVSHLYSFQRSPAWVVPKNQVVYPRFVIYMFTYLPFVMLLYRAFHFIIRDIRISQFGDVDSILAKYAKLAASSHMKNVFLSKGREDLIPKLVPNYPVGCKRVGLSDEYLEALCSSNVTVNRSPIIKIQGKNICTADGVESEIDTLVLATGFDVVAFLGEMKIYGRDGMSLNDIWEQKTPKTYKTVCVHGFPNLFMLLGPGSALGHNSIVTMIESQVDFGIEIISHMMQHRIQSMEPTKTAQETFSTNLRDKFKGTVWASGCKSWYMNKHGDVQSLWPQSVMKFIVTLKDTDFESDFIRT